MTKKRRNILALALALTLILTTWAAGFAESNDSLLSPEAIETLNSLVKVSDNYYRIEYTVDYALDELLAKGAATEDELNEFVSAQLLGGLPFYHYAPALACSAFSAITPDGDYITGRNLDIADAQNTLVYTRPENGYASVSTASGLLLGYYDSMPDSLMGRLFLLAAPYFPVEGMNEKGFTVSILLLYAAPPVNQETGKIPVTTSLAVRLLLDKAATVEEGIGLMASYDMHSIANSNIHFLLTDATGDSAVIEYVEGEMRILRSNGNGQVVTNFFLSPDVVEEYRDGEDRLEILQAVLDESKGIVTAEKAMEMLDSVKAVHDYDELSGIDYNTSYSIVFNNTKGTLDICTNMNYDEVYSFTLDFDK